MPDIEVRAVDDTARWVAHQRAVESARPDALFHDHLAARLAGARGREIAARAAAEPASPGGDGWYLVARTVLLDRASATPSTRASRRSSTWEPGSMCARTAWTCPPTSSGSRSICRR